MRKIPIPLVILLSAGLALAAMFWLVPDGDEADVREFPDQEALFKELLARTDDDGDARMSREEFDRYSNHHLPFASLDQDFDGYLDWQELRQAVASVEPSYKATGTSQGASDPVPLGSDGAEGQAVQPVGAPR